MANKRRIRKVLLLRGRGKVVRVRSKSRRSFLIPRGISNIRFW